MIVGVVGVSICDETLYSEAVEIGRIIAKKGHKLICGGLGGVMEAACRGAKEYNGVTIGILPTSSIHDANRFIDIPIATNMGHARNVIIVTTAETVIAIGKGYGTLSEIAIALKLGKKVYSWKSFSEIEGVIEVKNLTDFEKILN